MRNPMSHSPQGYDDVPISFTKASGAGNDFVLVNTIPRIRHRLRAFCRCRRDRHFGVGADGFLLLGKSGQGGFTMRYFNADGSSGGMCGNEEVQRAVWR